MRQESSTKPAPGRRGKPFQPGADPRRHVHSAACGHPIYKFTAADRSNGFFAALAVWGVSIGEKLHAAGRWPSYRGRRGAR